MKVGDLVVRTYGEGQRPTAIIVGVSDPSRWMVPVTLPQHPIVELIWTGRTRIVQFGSEHLELVSESR